MPRSSRHRSSHKSHRRSSPADWSASDDDRDSEPDRRKSYRDSSNGHGVKRKGRVDMKDEDRWESGVKDGDGEDVLVEKKRERERRHEGREKERYEGERRRERRKIERYEDEKREKERYEETTRKREADTAAVTVNEDIIQIGPKKEEEEIVQIEAVEKSTERDIEKLTKRRKDETSPSEKEKQHKSHSHSSKEKKTDTEKYRESEREKRHREREREERREREYAEYRSSRYRKRNELESDPFEEYSGSSSKYSRSSRRVYEENENVKYERESNNDIVNNDNRDAEMKEDYNYVKYPEREKEKEKEKEKVDRSSKVIESPKKEVPEERTKSTNSERTPSKRSIKLENSLEISSTEIHYERSPVSTPHYKYSTSSRGSGSSKYRERERERERDRERDGDVSVQDKPVQKREPTPIGTSNRPNSIRRPNYNYNSNNNNMNINSNNGNNNWNNGWNNNGFIPIPTGPPAQHGFNPFGGPPPLFNMRPPMKLGFHDPMDRFPMRPFAWHNGNSSGNNNLMMDDINIGNPNMWDPFNWENNNRAIGNPNMWNNNNININNSVNNNNNNNKGQGQAGELGNKEAIKEVKIEEMSEKEELMSYKEIKLEQNVYMEVRQNVENREKAPEILEEDKKSDDVAEFDLWEKYVMRVGVSKDLVDDVELYNKCASVLGDLGKSNGVSRNEKVKGKDGGMISVFKSVFPGNQDSIFHKSMSLYKKLADRPKFEANGNPVSQNSDKLVTSEENAIVIFNEEMEVEKKEFNDNNNDNENSEVVRGDNEVGLSRIPNFESTH